MRHALAVVLLSLLLAPVEGAANDTPKYSRATIERYLTEAANKHKIAPDLLKSVCHVESSLNHHAIGDDGRSIGLCQIQIDTALEYVGKQWMAGVPDRRERMRQRLLDPRINSDIAAGLLRRYLNRFEGNETLAIVAYNGGPDAKVIRYYLKVKAMREKHYRR